MSHELENVSQPYQINLDSLFYIPKKRKKELGNIVMKSFESSAISFRLDKSCS
jgi:hypothetical protein